MVHCSITEQQRILKYHVSYADLSNLGKGFFFSFFTMSYRFVLIAVRSGQELIDTSKHQYVRHFSPGVWVLAYFVSR